MATTLRERVAIAACDLRHDDGGPCRYPGADCLEIADRCIAASGAERLRAALAGMVGLIDLLLSRNDLGPVREPLTNSHRVVEARALLAELQPVDPRDPDPSREGVFRDHNCAVCDSGRKPCVRGNPRDCDTLFARND